MSQLSALAVSPPGFEDLVRDEVLSLGVSRAERVMGGVEFTGGWDAVAGANLKSRVASRILLRVGTFEAAGLRQFESRLKKIDWPAWVNPSGNLKVKVSKSRTRLYHTGKLADIARSVIAGRLGSFPPGADGPETLVYIRITGKRVVASVDTSGEHLHKRGYRSETWTAPLRENVAAALILRSGWAGGEPFLDPMCGSGTLPLEAARMALNIPPGWERAFAFEQIPCFDEKAWTAVRDECGERILARLEYPVLASDYDREAVELAVRTAKRAGVADQIGVAVCDVGELEAPEERGLLMANPPHGVRISRPSEALDKLHAALNGEFAGWRWGILSSGRLRENPFAKAREDGRTFKAGGLPLVLSLGGPFGCRVAEGG